MLRVWTHAMPTRNASQGLLQNDTQLPGHALVMLWVRKTPRWPLFSLPRHPILRHAAHRDLGGRATTKSRKRSDIGKHGHAEPFGTPRSTPGDGQSESKGSGSTTGMLPMEAQHARPSDFSPSP